MKRYFLKLFEFNAWANQQVLACLERQSVDDKKILDILGHILSAQMIWYHRVAGLPKSPLLLWGEYSLDQLKSMAIEGAANWLAFTEKEGTFERVLKYHNYVGNYYENRLEDLMTQLVNHASYHRGQIAVLLREKGHEPINTDFVTYDRIISGQLNDL